MFTNIGTELLPGLAWSPLAAIKRPGVYEKLMGQRHSEICMDKICVAVCDDNQLKALCPAADLRHGSHRPIRPAVRRSRRPSGSMLGSGAIMVMDETTDIPAAALTHKVLCPRVMWQMCALPVAAHGWSRYLKSRRRQGQPPRPGSTYRSWRDYLRFFPTPLSLQRALKRSRSPTK